MLSADNKRGIVISKTPVLRAGIGGIVERNFPEYALTYYSCIEDVALLQLKKASLIIVDLADEFCYARRRCQHYYSLFPQCDKARWVFFVPSTVFPVAMEFLLREQTTLLSDLEPVEGVTDAIRSIDENKEKISQMFLSMGRNKYSPDIKLSKILTASERNVLRLLGKGWGINQIATLLKKSNKTVSAQKNSAMRRLSLRSNADLYIWINSTQGMAELNSEAMYGDKNEWKIAARRETLPLLKNAQ